MHLNTYIQISMHLPLFCQTVSLENVLPESDPIDFHNATAPRGKKTHSTVAACASTATSLRPDKPWSNFYGGLPPLKFWYFNNTRRGKHFPVLEEAREQFRLVKYLTANVGSFRHLYRFH